MTESMFSKEFCTPNYPHSVWVNPWMERGAGWFVSSINILGTETCYLTKNGKWTKTWDTKLVIFKNSTEAVNALRAYDPSFEEVHFIF
jgi:hypothetical protein